MTRRTIMLLAALPALLVIFTGFTPVHTSIPKRRLDVRARMPGVLFLVPAGQVRRIVFV